MLSILSIPSDGSFRIQSHSYILSFIATSISHLHPYSLQSLLAHTDIAHIHLHTPQKHLITFKLITVSKTSLYHRVEVKFFHSAFGRSYFVLRLSAPTLDYSLKTLVENGLPSSLVDSLLSSSSLRRLQLLPEVLWFLKPL